MVELAHDVHGDASAPPLVLLHGLGESRDSWAGVVDDLAADLRVWALDLRGHGETGRSESGRPGDYSFELMADDVAAFLDARGLAGVAVVGHSMGGNVGLRLALRRPDLVARLVVEDVIPPHPREPRPATTVGWGGVDRRAIVAILRETNTRDEQVWADLAKVEARTLLVSGGAASHIPEALMADMAERMPRAELVTIDVGHHVHRAAPAEFARLVLEWLAQP